MQEMWDILDEHGNQTGRLVQRGNKMNAGEYHLVVHVWIVNDKDEFLISRRSPHIGLGGLWQTTGGSAVAGDDSLTTALKETREEIGITLAPADGTLYARLKMKHMQDEDGNFCDVWIFRHNCDIAEVTLEPNETISACWASEHDLRNLIASGDFVTVEWYPYLDDLLGHLRS